MLRPERDASSDVRPVIGPVQKPELHVMSYNLRNAGDGLPDPWIRRRPVMARLLDLERPSVIGIQEGLYRQVREVAGDLAASGQAYDWIGTGRDGGSRGEFAAIFFDPVRLEPLEFDHFWLSDTPDLVGSRTWGNDCVRMATWVRFADRETGVEFAVLNTHLDHAVELAQNRGAELIAARLAEFPIGLPTIVTGDFNVPAEHSRPYDTLLEIGLRDAWTVADVRLTPAVATFHGYQPAKPDGHRIDWILTSREARVRSAAINTFRTDDGWASDHYPVQAVLDLTSA